MISRQANINNIAAFTCSLDRKANAESVAIIYERVLTRIFWTLQSVNLFFLFFFYFMSIAWIIRYARNARFFADENNEFKRVKLSLNSRLNFLEKVNLDVDLCSHYMRNMFDMVSMNLRVIHHNGRCIIPSLRVILHSILLRTIRKVI